MSPTAKAGLLKIQIDGAARGNPGPAGAGIVFLDGSRPVKRISIYLGEATNNVAEAAALIVALQEALKLNRRRVTVQTDSELIARQVQGAYKVKNKQLQWLHAIIKNLTDSFDRFEIQHIPREQNRKADKLANKAVDDGIRRQPLKPRKQAPVPDTRQPSLF